METLHADVGYIIRDFLTPHEVRLARLATGALFFGEEWIIYPYFQVTRGRAPPKLNIHLDDRAELRRQDQEATEDETLRYYYKDNTDISVRIIRGIVQVKGIFQPRMVIHSYTPTNLLRKQKRLLLNYQITSLEVKGHPGVSDVEVLCSNHLVAVHEQESRTIFFSIAFNSGEAHVIDATNVEFQDLVTVNTVWGNMAEVKLGPLNLRCFSRVTLDP